MPRKQKTIHYLYKTTCLITGRYYIGMHSTSNMEDGYMGSGKRLRYSIRKYGAENHIKEILGFFDSRESLVEAEKKTVNSDLMQDKNCMNLKEGGTGGLSNSKHRNSFILAGIKNFNNSYDERNKKIFEIRNNPETLKEYGKKVSKGLLKYYETNFNAFKNKKHSENTKQKISELKKGTGIKETNSQYGTMWITNGTENKKIKKEDVIPEGWYKGRKI
jgi:hypothetical protein